MKAHFLLCCSAYTIAAQELHRPGEGRVLCAQFSLQMEIIAPNCLHFANNNLRNQFIRSLGLGFLLSSSTGSAQKWRLSSRTRVVAVLAVYNKVTGSVGKMTNSNRSFLFCLFFFFFL